MESAQNYYYSITKRMLSLVGQWPYQEKRTRLFRVSSITGVLFSMIVPQVAKMYHCDGNTRCILLTIPSFIMSAIILIKLYSCQFNSSRIKSLTDHLRDDWAKLNDVNEHEIMKTYGANARLLSLAYCSCGFIAINIFLSISLLPKILNTVLPLNESRPVSLPYEAYYFVDDEEYFFYILLHFSMGINIVVVAIFAHDCMLLVYIEHACSLFAVTGFRLETLSRNDDNNKAYNCQKGRKFYDRKITGSIHAHWRALRFAEILEDIFCTTFILQMALVVVGLSITLLQIAMQLGEIMETIKFVLYVMGQVIHVFCYSLQGQKLIDHSVQMRDKIYNSFWYDIPVESQRLLLYVMRRSLEPTFLSAGKIYVFSLKSFTTVMQSSVSYFTVLASFQ